MRLPDFLRTAVRPAGPRQESPPTSGSRWRETTGRGNLYKARWQVIHRPADTREASDSPDLRYATPSRSGVRACGHHFPFSPNSCNAKVQLPSILLFQDCRNSPPCQHARFAVVSDLPITRLTRATRMREVQARRRADKIAGQFIPFRLRAAIAHIGRALPEESTGHDIWSQLEVEHAQSSCGPAVEGMNVLFPPAGCAMAQPARPVCGASCPGFDWSGDALIAWARFRSR